MVKIIRFFNIKYMTKREYLKELLLFANTDQLYKFKGFYSYYNMQESLDETINNLDIIELNKAINECESIKDLYLRYNRNKKLHKLNI